jgi:hypothetical protein
MDFDENCYNDDTTHNMWLDSDKDEYDDDEKSDDDEYIQEQYQSELLHNQASDNDHLEIVALCSIAFLIVVAIIAIII